MQELIPQQPTFCWPPLKHSDRSSYEDLPADFHCNKCSHKLADGKDFYFSTTQGPPAAGIHTAIWLKPDYRLLEDDLGLKVDSKFRPVGKKGLGHSVFCRQCDTFLGTCTHDRAGPLQPGWRVKLRYATFPPGSPPPPFEGCTQVIVLKPLGDLDDLQHWIDTLPSWTGPGCKRLVEMQHARTRPDQPDLLVFKDAELLYNGWLEDLPLGELENAFRDFLTVGALQKLASNDPDGYTDYLVVLLGVLKRLSLKGLDQESRKRLAERIFKTLKDKIGVLHAKVYMQMLHIFGEDKERRRELYREALGSAVADRHMFNFVLSLSFQGNYQEALAVLEGRSSELEKPPMVQSADVEGSPMPPSTLRELLKTTRMGRGTKADVEGLKRVVTLLSSGRVQTPDLDDQKEQGHRCQLLADLFEYHRTAGYRDDRLLELQGMYPPNPTAKPILEVARYLHHFDNKDNARGFFLEATEKLLAIGTEDPDAIGVMDVLSAQILNPSWEFSDTLPAELWRRISELWETVKDTVAPSVTSKGSPKLDPCHWNWTGDLPLPERKYVETGAFWMVAVIKQIEEVQHMLNIRDEIEIVTGRGAHAVGGKRSGEKPSLGAEVLRKFLEELVGKKRVKFAYDKGVNVGSLKVDGLWRALYDGDPLNLERVCLAIRNVLFGNNGSSSDGNWRTRQ